MDDEVFYKLVEKAVSELPKEFAEKVENVAVLVEEWPSPGQVEKLKTNGGRGLILGLYEGIPKTRRGRYGIGGQLPDKITLFKMPILIVSGRFENVEKTVQETVIHEIAHHFGISDAEIERIKKGH